MFSMGMDTAIYVLPLCMAISIGLPFFLAGYIMADIPHSQVMKTFGLLGTSNVIKKRPLNGIAKLFGTSSDDGSLEAKKDEERERIEIWLRRLGKRQTYDDIVAQQNVMILGGTLVGVIVALFGIALEDSTIILLGIMCIPVFIFAGLQTKVSLKSQIKRLNKSILFEMPMLIKIFVEMKNSQPLSKQIESYLPQAGAFREDLEITLADIKNYTEVRALVELSNRVQNGDRVEEVGQFIDQLKSLFTNGDPLSCAQNLNLLADRIYDVHINKYIKSESDKKMITLQVCICVIVVLVVFLYISPSLLELIRNMNELNQ